MYSTTKNISNEKVASESDAKTLPKCSAQTMAIETDETSHNNNSEDHHEIETYVVPDAKKKVCT